MAWRGAAIGLIISAPMGPVGMLCIQRTLDKGRRAGFYTGIGAAISDLFYSVLTGLGLSFIEEFLERNSNIIQLAGCIVLIAFGIYLFRKNPTKGLRKPREEAISIKKNILGGFLFTFSNPLILFLIIGLFARFNFLLTDTSVNQHFTTFQYGIIYLIGYLFIFAGALGWWWLITFSASKVRNHFNIRSMWLINKIIGVIILLFAVVGIFTASSALAKGADIRCWNEKRGFDSFSSAWTDFSENGDGILANLTTDTIQILTSTEGADAVEFRFKAHNLHCSPAKKYKAADSGGRHTDVSMPAWGILLTAPGGSELKILFRSTETDNDISGSQAAFEAQLLLDGEVLTADRFADNSNIVSKLRKGLSGPDPTGALNFFKLSLYDGNLTLFGGIHSPERLIHTSLDKNFIPDSIGFFLNPASAVEFSEIRITTSDFHSRDSADIDIEYLDEYFLMSHDFIEGYWQVLDRSLEESLLRPGGDYRLAAVRHEDGYKLLYIDGARINSSKWEAGMVKARLLPAGIPGIWNVEWYDAMFQSLHKDIKAQTDDNGVLTIQFPYQSSQIRLIHTIPEAASDR